MQFKIPAFRCAIFPIQLYREMHHKIDLQRRPHTNNTKVERFLSSLKALSLTQSDRAKKDGANLRNDIMELGAAVLCGPVLWRYLV